MTAALFLSLPTQRGQESREYRELHSRVNAGIKTLTQDEIRRLEELFQMYHNGEFSEKGQAKLESLVAQRTARMQTRLAEGQPPFEETFFQRWAWNSEGRTYEWQAKEGDNPRDFNRAGFAWEPRELGSSELNLEHEKTTV